MIKVREGSKIYYSEIGYKGFHYPSNQNSFLTTEELEIHPLAWVTTGSDDRIPATLSLPDNLLKVIWVKKEDLLS